MVTRWTFEAMDIVNKCARFGDRDGFKASSCVSKCLFFFFFLTFWVCRGSGDHHCTCVKNGCHFFLFSNSFKTKEKKLTIKGKDMTKIASRGPPHLQFLPPVFLSLLFSLLLLLTMYLTHQPVLSSVKQRSTCETSVPSDDGRGWELGVMEKLRFLPTCCHYLIDLFFFILLLFTLVKFSIFVLRPECVFSKFLVSFFFFFKSMRAGGKKNIKCQKKNTTLAHLQTWMRTHPTTVLDTPHWFPLQWVKLISTLQRLSSLLPYLFLCLASTIISLRFKLSFLTKSQCGAGPITMYVCLLFSQWAKSVRADNENHWKKNTPRP